VATDAVQRGFELIVVADRVRAQIGNVVLIGGLGGDCRLQIAARGWLIGLRGRSGLGGGDAEKGDRRGSCPDR
jgi:hypothetical protein